MSNPCAVAEHGRFVRRRPRGAESAARERKPCTDGLAQATLARRMVCVVSLGLPGEPKSKFTWLARLGYACTGSVPRSQEVRGKPSDDSSRVPLASQVNLVDATYELFRAFFGAPPKTAPDGREVGAVRGLVATLIYLLKNEGATHVGCATDHVIRSFRNELWPGYKTEEGIPDVLWSQFPIAEDAMRALGLVVWPMVDFEADDALATSAARLSDACDQVVICTVDKDLAQCVRGDRVILRDRRRKTDLNEAGVIEKFGVAPLEIPDYLALVGDTADGYPGLPGFGSKSAAALVRAFGSIEAIPADTSKWPKAVRGAPRLAATLEEHRAHALLFKKLATLRTDAPANETLEELRWRGPRPELRSFCKELGFEDLVDRVPAPV